MLLFKKKQKYGVVCSPVKGTYIEMKDIRDPVFSQGTVGKGFAVRPEGELVCSPVEGKITVVFPTLHAVGITDKQGLEYIVHIGVDTVSLQGRGFKQLCQENQTVKVGEPLIKVDFSLLRSHGYADDVIVIVSNASSVNFTIKKNELSIGEEVFVCEQ